ncbi:MAG: DUF2283 domain-containing protein [Anaerolineae bacterium]|nr:DUF2283 domain-containing protein [Anaerolineae bacterium]
MARSADGSPSADIILDLDAEGRMVGLEVLNLSSRVEPGRLRVVQVETT